MNDTYRLSESLPMRQFLVTSSVTLMVLVVVTVRSLRAGEGAAMLYVSLVVAACAGIYYWRIYKQALFRTKNHTLALIDDAVLISDGPTQRRMPYDAIELLRIRRPLFGNANFQLRVRGMPTETYFGYENVEALISSLATRVPRERVRGSLVHV